MVGASLPIAGAWSRGGEAVATGTNGPGPDPVLAECDRILAEVDAYLAGTAPGSSNRQVGEDEIPDEIQADVTLRLWYPRCLRLSRLMEAEQCTPPELRSAVIARCTNSGVSEADAKTIAHFVANAKPPAHPRLVQMAKSGAAFIAQKTPRPTPILGNGLVSAGDFCVIYSRPGLSKTQLAFQFTASVVGGQDFFGYQTMPVPVLLVTLEDHDHFNELRLATVFNSIYGPSLGKELLNSMVTILTPSMLGAKRLDLVNRLDEFRELIEGKHIGLAFLDPLRKLHRGEEGLKELGPVLDAMLDMTMFTPLPAVVLLHHDRKSQGRDEDDQDAASGTGRILGDARLGIRIKPLAGAPDYRELVFTKVSHARRPSPLTLRVKDDDSLHGMLEAADRPVSTRKSDTRRDALRDALKTAGPEGMSRAEAEEVTGLKERGAIKALRDVGARFANGRWRHAVTPSAEQETIL